MKDSGAPDEILTYSYAKPWVQWFPNKEDPLTDPSGSLGGSGHCPVVMLACALRQGDPVKVPSLVLAN
jgi:hypothetical protein